MGHRGEEYLIYALMLTTIAIAVLFASMLVAGF